MEKGKHIFGTVKMGDKGQVVIPKDARRMFNMNPGDMLIVLGDENQGGIALAKFDSMRDFARALLAMDKEGKEE